MSGSSATDRILNQGFISFKFFLRKLAQRLDGELLSQVTEGLLAFASPGIIGRTYKTMFDFTVGNDNSGIRQQDRRIFVLQGLSIEKNGAVLFAHGTGELIHNTTVHFTVMVLGILADQGQILVGEICKAIEISQHDTRQHLQGCGGGEAGTIGDIAIDHEIHAPVHLIAPKSEGPHNALEVVGPVGFISWRQTVNTGGGNSGTVEIHGIEANLVIVSQSCHSIGSYGQSAGKYMTAVVICMFADQIHSSRCKIGSDVPSRAEFLVKLLLQIFQHNMVPRFLLFAAFGK